MKSIIFLIAALVISVSLYSVDLGIGGLTSFQSESFRATRDFSETSFGGFSYFSNMNLKPFIRIEFSETFYLEPFVSYHLIDSQSSEETSSDFPDYFSTTLGGGICIGKIAYKNNFLAFNYGLDAGVSFNYEPTGTDAIDYDSYNNFEVKSNFLISVDFSLSKRLKVRIAQDILKLQYFETTTESNSIENIYSYTNLNTVMDGLSPTIGLYLMF